MRLRSFLLYHRIHGPAPWPGTTVHANGRIYLEDTRDAIAAAPREMMQEDHNGRKGFPTNSSSLAVLVCAPFG